MAIWFDFYENGPFNPKKFDKENESQEPKQLLNWNVIIHKKGSKSFDSKHKS